VRGIINQLQYGFDCRFVKYISKTQVALIITNAAQLSIHQRLSTAHCFHDGTRFLSGSNYVCAMGSLDRWIRTNNTLYINVLQAIGHKKFNPKNFANDIGLMILSQEVPMNHPTVQPIMLSEKNGAAGQSCQVLN
jgi:secreted trypsin-like serine protease